jgi:hypothetical protein
MNKDEGGRGRGSGRGRRRRKKERKKERRTTTETFHYLLHLHFLCIYHISLPLSSPSFLLPRQTKSPSVPTIGS